MEGPVSNLSSSPSKCRLSSHANPSACGVRCCRSRQTWCSVREGWGVQHTIAWCAKALISLMARGALFLKVTPCSCSKPLRQHLVPNNRLLVEFRSVSVVDFGRTYPLVHVDGVLAGDHVLDGGPASLLVGRHFYSLKKPSLELTLQGFKIRRDEEGSSSLKDERCRESSVGSWGVVVFEVVGCTRLENGRRSEGDAKVVGGKNLALPQTGVRL